MPRIVNWATAAVFIATALAGNGAPASAADVENGERWARRSCSGCHVVANDQRQASADVPTFAAIARRPDFSTESVAGFLLSPHPTMPDFPLTRAEAEDIASYIASQAK